MAEDAMIASIPAPINVVLRAIANLTSALF
jgi:hypothetical protein